MAVLLYMVCCFDRRDGDVGTGDVRVCRATPRHRGDHNELSSGGKNPLSLILELVWGLKSCRPFGSLVLVRSAAAWREHPGLWLSIIHCYYEDSCLDLHAD